MRSEARPARSPIARLRRLCPGLLAALSCIGTVGAPASSPARSHAPEFIEVFQSGFDGYHTFRIPALAVTRNGTILAFCEGRKNSRADTGDIDLLVKRSSDGGRTWTPPQIVWSDGENTCGNPAPVMDRTTGIIHLLMTWNCGSDREADIHAGRGRDTRRVFITRSTDEGRTWAKPREITPTVKRPDWRWYATGPVNGIQLTRGPHAGRLLIPCNHSSPGPEGRAVSWSHVIYSDDAGRSWAKSRTLLAGPSAYSCLAVLESGWIGCLFECGQQTPYERIVLARVPLAWIED